jgi:hypothetical protein
MNTFKNFLNSKLNEDAPPAGGISGPGALPPSGAPPMGGMGAPPMGGMGAPPMGGMGAPPMGGMGGPTGGTAPQKLKAYNVWDVLERVLSDDNQ